MNTETIQEARDEFLAAAAKARYLMGETLETNKDFMRDIRVDADWMVQYVTELLLEQEARSIADEWLENLANYEDANDFVREQANDSRMVFMTWEAECIARYADEEALEEAKDISGGEVVKVETIAYCVLLRMTLDLIEDRQNTAVNLNKLEA